MLFIRYNERDNREKHMEVDFMYQFPISYICGWSAEALDLAVELKLNGVHVAAPVAGKAPRDMKGAKLAEYKDMLASRGLIISAFMGDIGGYTNPEQNPARVEEFCRIVDLGLELGTKIVTTHIGIVPDDPSDAQYKIMQDACGKISEHCGSVGAKFAVETGPELATVLKGFLDTLPKAGAGVNLDPANLTMCACDDAVGAVHTLKDYIVHTHAKDGKNIKPRTATQDWEFIETPLGQGDVDFPNYLKALEEIGFRGFLAIEREIADPIADIRLAANFLRSLLKG